MSPPDVRRAARRIATGLTMLTGTGAGASAVLAVLVVACVFGAMAGPRQSELSRTRVLHSEFAALPATGRTVVVSLDYFSLATVLGSNGVPADRIDASNLDRIGALIGGRLSVAHVPLQPRSAQWSGLTTGTLGVTGAPRSGHSQAVPLRVQIMFRGRLGRYALMLSGHLPDASTVTRAATRLEVAVTAATATRLGLRQGSALHLGSQLTLVVSGILRPRQPGSSFWTEDSGALAPTLIQPASSPGYWLGSVFAGPDELAGLEGAVNPGLTTVTWEFPLRLGSVTASQAGPLSNALEAAYAKAGVLNADQFSPIDAGVSSGVTAPLGQFLQTQDQVGSLLSLLFASLAVIGAVVLLLGGRLLAERRSAEFGLMLARGAARRQLAVLAFRAGVVVALPAAACGALAAVALTPGGDTPVAWWLSGATLLVVLAGVPVLAVRLAPAGGMASERADRRPGRAARARRLVADGAMVAAAIGGLVILRQQGPPPPGGTNWYTSAAPVLVALPAAIAVIRGYPYLVRSLVRLAGRSRGVTAFAGLARAARASATAVLPAFALVLVLAVIGFGAMVRAAVIRGDVAQSWRLAGADVIIDATQSYGGLDPAAQRAIAAVPGVRRTTVLRVLSSVTASGTPLDVAAVSPASYAALAAGTPLPAFPAAALARPAAGSEGPVPVLASPAAAALIGGGTTVYLSGGGVRIRVAGVVSSAPGMTSGGEFIVAPSWALGPGGPAPNLMLAVGPDVAGSRLEAVVRRAAPGASVTFRSALLASLTTAPIPRAAYRTFAQGAVAAAGFGAVILLIMLALGARGRELALARLVTMGLSQRQARRLLVAEVLPSLVAAAAGGAASALALVPLVGPAIDLSVLTGSTARVPMRADIGLIGYLAAGMLVLALGTLFAQSASTRLRGVASALRVGE